jgi:hypothetical protein
MSDPRQSVDDETLQFMHSTPVFDLEQQRRYEDLLQIGSEIQTIAAHFVVYADLGQKMCLEFASLQKSFDRMEVMSADSSIRPLGKLFRAVDRAFTCHFNDVSQRIVTNLNSFVRKELEGLATLEREHQHLLRDFRSAEDEYINMKIQAARSKKQKTEQSLTQSHTISTLAFFEFCQKMEGIELKLRSILPRTFLAFLTSISGPFRDCLAEINDHEDLLNSAQTSIQQVDQQILDFSQHSAEMKQRLSSQIPVFWNRLTEPFTRTSLTSIQGYLWKKKSGLSRSWHKRFFIVSNCVLSWARTVDEALRSEKSVHLLLCSVRPEPNGPRPNCFSITRKGMPPMILQALTPWDVDQWLAVIQNAIASQLNSSGPTQSITCDTVCADCGALNASWACINWGVTICEACAGEHRGLPASVSRVRSLNLDDVDPLHQALVEAIGTERGNSVLEAVISEDEKIHEDATPQMRRRYCEAKYKDKAWVADPGDIDIIAAVQNQDLMEVYRFIAAGRLAQTSGFTAIHAAACVGNPLIMHLVLLNSTKIGTPDDAGWTPLCYAVYHEQGRMVDVLFEYGAELYRDGVNPYDIAKSRNDEALMAKLVAFAETSQFDPDIAFKPPHEEAQPATFEFERFVADPTAYAPKGPDSIRTVRIMEKKQRSLNRVVSRMSAKLSVRGAKRDTSERNRGEDEWV